MNSLLYSLIKKTHPEWQKLLSLALEQVDKRYLQELEENNEWLPGKKTLFAAFSEPLSTTRYILLGESPYPRKLSANGYAFWDEAVDNLWSTTGLSKTVNRATSLRNLIKMLLLARGDLVEDCSQGAIAELDKSLYCQTAAQFFTNLLAKGFLLLNASLVYSKNNVQYHARHWKPFMQSLFEQLAAQQQPLRLILFGQIAKQLPETDLVPCLIAEHPYNLSFIKNPAVLAFFKPLDLLACL